MTKPTYVYVVYIRTTPEQAWNALMDGELTRSYWQHDNVSDWKVGSRWEHRRLDAERKVDVTGEVLEIDPPRRMVWSWVSPADWGNVAKTSRVTFEVEPFADMVRLTVTHGELEAGSAMERGINSGWPKVLSSLKSQLETGKPLDVYAKPLAG